MGLSSVYSVTFPFFLQMYKQQKIQFIHSFINNFFLFFSLQVRLYYDW